MQLPWVLDQPPPERSRSPGLLAAHVHARQSHIRCGCSIPSRRCRLNGDWVFPNWAMVLRACASSCLACAWLISSIFPRRPYCAALPCPFLSASGFSVCATKTLTGLVSDNRLRVSETSSLPAGELRGVCAINTLTGLALHNRLRVSETSSLSAPPVLKYADRIRSHTTDCMSFSRSH
jgi:hypothetical protein